MVAVVVVVAVAAAVAAAVVAGGSDNSRTKEGSVHGWMTIPLCVGLLTSRQVDFPEVWITGAPKVWITGVSKTMRSIRSDHRGAIHTPF